MQRVDYSSRPIEIPPEPIADLSTDESIYSVTSNSDQLNSNDITSLLKKIAANERIHEIDLCFPPEYEENCSGFWQRTQSIVKATFRDCPLDFLSGLTNNKSLTSLDVSQASVFDDQLNALMQTVANHKYLSIIKLPYGEPRQNEVLQQIHNNRVKQDEMINDVTQLLLDSSIPVSYRAGVPIFAQDSEGDTLLHFAVLREYPEVLNKLMVIARLEDRLVLLKNNTGETAYGLSSDKDAERFVIGHWLRTKEVISHSKALRLLREQEARDWEDRFSQLEQLLAEEVCGLEQRFIEAASNLQEDMTRQVGNEMRQLQQEFGIDFGRFRQEIRKVVQTDHYKINKDKVRNIARDVTAALPQAGQRRTTEKLERFYDCLLAGLHSKTSAAVVLSSGRVLASPSWKHKAVKLYFKILGPSCSLAMAPAPSGAQFAGPAAALAAAAAEHTVDHIQGQDSSRRPWTMTYSIDPQKRFQSNAEIAFQLTNLLRDIIANINEKKGRHLAKDITGDLWYHFEKLSNQSINGHTLAKLAFAIVCQSEARTSPQVGPSRSGNHKVYQDLRTIDLFTRAKARAFHLVCSLPNISDNFTLHFQHLDDARAYIAYLAKYHEIEPINWNEEAV